MDETQLRLDGNAAAGMLREISVHEMSTARGAASCGGHRTNRELASLHGSAIAWSGAPLPDVPAGTDGACSYGRGYRFGMNGLKWMEILS